jgi:hypothetical protein
MASFSVAERHNRIVHRRSVWDDTQNARPGFDTASAVTSMVKKMAGLLDDCIMMWGSGLEDGNVHTGEDLPFVIAGT